MASYNPMAFAADQSFTLNGKAHSWKDLDIKMLGSSIQYIKSISYDASREKSFDVGAGQVGKFYGEGNDTVSGSLEVSVSEMMKLVSAAQELFPGAGPLDIPPFTLSITYYSTVGNIATTNLYNVALTKEGPSHSEGDTHLYTSFDFIATAVVTNIA